MNGSEQESYTAFSSLAVTTEFQSTNWTELAEGLKVAKRPKGKTPFVIVEISYTAIPQCEEHLRKVMQLLLRPLITQEVNMQEKARKAKGE